MNLLLCIGVLLIQISTASYLQMPLIRTPQKSKQFNFTSIKCSDSSNHTSDADYKEICFEKDITYSVPFIKDGLHYSLSADFTTPLSWIKNKNCIVQGTNEKCTRLTETVIEKVKQSSKHKSKLHKMASDQSEQNTIIEGSSQTIRGQFEKEKNISLIVKDSNRLNNFFQMIMLGLFIYGEKDNITLEKTNFVNAMYISPNLNRLSDGAISLRFDSTAENSFLQEIFTYVQALEKSVTVSIGNSSNNITIGDLTAKYTKFGYSGIQWISMPNDQGYGRLPEIMGVGIDDLLEDREDETQEDIYAAFTLSASYISFPEQVLNTALIKRLQKVAICKINSDNFVECSSTSKRKLQQLMDKNLVIKFQKSNMIISLRKLVLKVDHEKRAIFNIKKSFNKYAILGEPIFEQYVMFFDYLKNRIGFSEKREELNQFMIEVVTLVRFLCCTMVLGCCFICCFEPCQRLARHIKKIHRQIKKQQFKKTVRDRQEQPMAQKKSPSLNDSVENQPQNPFSQLQEL